MKIFDAGLKPDTQNANEGTQRGLGLLDKSLRKLGAGRSILVDKDGNVIAGNKTLERAADIDLPVRIVETDGQELVVVKRMDLDLYSDKDKRARQLAYADNKVAELDLAWKPEQIALDFEPLDLGEWGFEQLIEGDDNEEHLTLADKFIVPPFSVLDARQGYWQDRKRAWIALGIKSELGRGENLQGLSDDNDLYHYHKDEFFAKRNTNGLLGFSQQSRNHYKDTLGAIAPNEAGENGILTRTGKYGKSREVATSNSSQSRLNALQKTGDSRAVDYGTEGNASEQSGTSIFDPVLCELAYRWFMPSGDGSILDPFAGGSVRGIIASLLGKQYTGIDLSDRQIQANKEQIIATDKIPNWIVGDSRNIKELVSGEYDFIFSCPPYANLEVYSDDPQDLSTLAYSEFITAYRQIINDCVSMLKQDRFACFVVGDIRDKKGYYCNFPADTIQAFEDAGMTLYNEAILVTAVGSLPIRVGRKFQGYRKLGKTHQNVLVFYKGDPKAIKQYGDVECSNIEDIIQNENSTP